MNKLKNLWRDERGFAEYVGLLIALPMLLMLMFYCFEAMYLTLHKKRLERASFVLINELSNGTDFNTALTSFTNIIDADVRVLKSVNSTIITDYTSNPDIPAFSDISTSQNTRLELSARYAYTPLVSFLPGMTLNNNKIFIYKE